jgi:putative OPT family oligopeptide transporter
VVAAAFVVAPILTLLLRAYGIVEPASPDRDALAAPQATLMASVAKGVFEQNLPWTMVVIGMAVAVGIIVVDTVLERRSSAFRTPVLAVAIGIYLPLELAIPIFVGGMIAFAAHRGSVRTPGSVPSKAVARISGGGEGRGLLFAAGLITGEALLGILLAIPIVLFQGRNPIDLSGGQAPSGWPGVILLIAVIVVLYRIAVRGNDRARS